MKKIASVAMRAGLIVMVVLFAVMSLFPARVMGLFTSDAAIISEGVNYVSIIRFTYPSSVCPLCCWPLLGALRWWGLPLPLPCPLWW